MEPLGCSASTTTRRSSPWPGSIWDRLPRVTFLVEDGDEAIGSLKGEAFDFVFADRWPGKLRLLDGTLDLLAPGGLRLIDDLLSQENWPPRHGVRVEDLESRLMAREDLIVARLDWSCGVLLATRRPR